MRTAAQAKPDFSGTWTFDEAKSDPAQHAGAVVVAAGWAAQPVVHKLDGSESSKAAGEIYNIQGSVLIYTKS